MIYSDTAPNRMVSPNIDGILPSMKEEKSRKVLVAEALSEACASTTFGCGADLYNTGHRLREVFITQGALTCADPIEPHFYTLSARIKCGLTEKVCCFCCDEQDQGSR